VVVVEHSIFALPRVAFPFVLAGFDPADVNDIVDNVNRNINVVGIPHQINKGLVVFCAVESTTYPDPITPGNDRDRLRSTPLDQNSVELRLVRHCRNGNGLTASHSRREQIQTDNKRCAHIGLTPQTKKVFSDFEKSYLADLMAKRNSKPSHMAYYLPGHLSCTPSRFKYCVFSITRPAAVSKPPKRLLGPPKRLH
jgi:hypothetical protein